MSNVFFYIRDKTHNSLLLPKCNPNAISEKNDVYGKIPMKHTFTKVEILDEFKFINFKYVDWIHY